LLVLFLFPKAGIGLTLTGADRVVVYDPSWNPAEDDQAVGEFDLVSLFSSHAFRVLTLCPG